LRAGFCEAVCCPLVSALSAVIATFFPVEIVLSVQMLRPESVNENSYMGGGRSQIGGTLLSAPFVKHCTELLIV